MTMRTESDYRAAVIARRDAEEIDWARRSLRRELRADDLEVLEPGLFCHAPDGLLYRQAVGMMRAAKAEDLSRRGTVLVVEGHPPSARYLDPDTTYRTRDEYDRRKADEAAAAEAATAAARDRLMAQPLHPVTLAAVLGRRVPDVDEAITTIERLGGVVRLVGDRVLVEVRTRGNDPQLVADAAAVIHAADPWIAPLLSAGKPVPAGVQITPNGIPVRDGKVVR